MKRLTEGPTRKQLKSIPYGHVADVAGYGWVIPLKPCDLMNAIMKNHIAVANVDCDHIALLDGNLPAVYLGPAEIGYERT